MAFEDLHRPLGAAGLRGAVGWIIIVSGAILFLQQFAGHWMVPAMGLVPRDVLGRGWVWQPFTYLFLHGGVFHWLFNMFVLWAFGAELERRWGTFGFLKFFFITGVGAALGVLALTPHSHVPTIGASGAVFGVLTAFAMLFPHATLYLYFIIPLKAWQAVILFGLIELFAGFEGGGLGIARFAHLGGMITAYFYLRFSGAASIQLKGFRRSWERFRTRKRAIHLYEVSDDLVKEVDRILEKVLREGAGSLSPNEKEIMERYAARRR